MYKSTYPSIMTGSEKPANAEANLYLYFVFELSLLDPFVVVDFELARKPVLPSSSAARCRKRVSHRKAASVRRKAGARRVGKQVVSKECRVWWQGRGVSSRNLLL